MIVLWLILAVVVVMAAVVLVRTARFTPGTAPAVPEGEESIDRDKAVENLRTLIRCRTVSTRTTRWKTMSSLKSSSIPCRRSTPTFSRPASLSALRTVACCSPGPARSTPSRPY